MFEHGVERQADGGDLPIPVEGHLIDGVLRRGPETFEVINPATGRPFALCPSAGRADLDDAVRAARREAASWRALASEERRRLIFQFADRMVEAAGDIAPLLTQEHGKPLEQAKFELTVAAHHMKQLSSISIDDEVLRDDDARGRVLLRYHPLGVVGAIAPWNFPIALAMHKVAQALYTGNTLILKPSPFTPLATLAVAALARDIFPAGVINVIAGGNEFGAWMSSHEGIDKITFTGSVETGKKVMASASATLKRITLELGGNDAALVLDDADLDVVVPGLARSAFYNSGQICMATKRVYVADALHDAFVDRLAAALDHHRPGDGMDPSSTLGPLQNAAQFGKVKAYLEDALRQDGAALRSGGDVAEAGGYFISPTVITGLSDEARLVREEQFGPVLPVLRFADIDEAVARINDSRFGLGASVWGRDLDRALGVAERLNAGTVWVNRHGVNESEVPFGGMKDSGYGREHGQLGLRSYMELQVVSLPPQPQPERAPAPPAT